jgi:protein-S-isoprenylcysteine O-methyltransferase Ste14
MPAITQRLDDWLRSLGTFDGLTRTLVLLCAFATLTAVLLNFLLAQKAAAVKRERRSVVATGTMLGFFAGYYCLLRFRIGAVDFLPGPIEPVAAVVGLALLVAGTCVNILGRIALGGNWGDHIRIYQDHGLITRGVYRLLRHPLYASLIWMFCGAALVFQNWLALLANLGLFLPAMYYRARQEEVALTVEFPAYAAYRRTTGMFFPKLWKRK